MAGIDYHQVIPSTSSPLLCLSCLPGAAAAAVEEIKSAATHSGTAGHRRFIRWRQARGVLLLRKKAPQQHVVHIRPT